MQNDPRPGTAPLENTVLGTLGIEVLEASGERVVLTMPVGPQVHQPYGILHGGVSVVLAETAASVGAGLAAGSDRAVFGMEINANHLRPIRSGTVTTVGTPIHVGRTTQVWETRTTDERDRLVSVSRCTLAVRERSASS